MPPHIFVVGTGPAGLMAADAAVTSGCRVSVFDHMRAPGRKFLLAGRGGLNLTHSETLETLVAKYSGSAAGGITAAIQDFAPQGLIAWCEAHGQPTFVGSSGRVFPKAMKASPLLRAWLADLDRRGVAFRFSHRLIGLHDHGHCEFQTSAGQSVIERADAVVLALGGASWPRLGSDGRWRDMLIAHGVPIEPLVASNCGVDVPWSDYVKDRFGGQPLKRIAVSLPTVGHAVYRGEAIITREGLEGGAIYAASHDIRAALAQAPDGAAWLAIDLRPDMSVEEVASRIGRPRQKASLATHLRKSLSLEAQAIALLHEAGDALPTEALALAGRIKRLPIRFVGLSGLERAISSAGGVMAAGLTDGLMLDGLPGVFVAGEMLDFDAPTGGYLLQAAFATGVRAGRAAADWVRSPAGFSERSRATVKQC